MGKEIGLRPGRFQREAQHFNLYCLKQSLFVVHTTEHHVPMVEIPRQWDIPEASYQD